MNILFIGYWSINEGLSVATIDPHLTILSQFPEVQHIVYVSIERNREPLRSLALPKVQHVPFYSSPSLVDKLKDYIRLPKRLAYLCRQCSTDLIIGRGAPAGALSYLVWKRQKLPFCVESFEPHADYMRESGVWSRVSLHYLLSRHWEQKQKKHATLLIPVAKNYRQRLIKEGVVRSKIKVVPCTVDVAKFQFNVEDRTTIRETLNVDDDTVVGIYVGKYGGIYLDEAAFQLYHEAFHYWKDFFLIILSPQVYHAHIHQRIAEFALPTDKVVIKEVQHQEVPRYLAASEFGFATIKPAKSRLYCSAVKIGEYWANGLPTILTEGVGDDATIVVEEKIGTLVRKDVSGAFTVNYDIIQTLLNNPTSRSRIQSVAHQHRHRRIVKEAYEYLLKQKLS